MSRSDKRDYARSFKSMWGNIFQKKDANRTVIRESLKNIPLFEGLSNKELSRVQESLYLRKYRTDEYIFREGEPGLGMYIIQKGSVRIQKEKDTGIDTMIPTLELEKDDFFGEMCLLEEHPHLVSAKAHTYTELLGLFRPDLLTLINVHPRLGTKLLSALGRVISARFRASLPGSEED